MLYIDAFNHILPKKYQAVLEQKVPNRDMSSNLSRYAETVPTLLDLDARFRLMDSVEGYMQVLTLAAPTVESVASPEVAVDLCRFANDEMAELVEKYPDRFAAAIAALLKIPASFVNGSFSIFGAVLLYVPLKAALGRARLLPQT